MLIFHFIQPNKNFIKIYLSNNKSNFLLHCAFIGLHLYYNISNELPELNNLEQIKKLLNFFLKIIIKL